MKKKILVGLLLVVLVLSMTTMFACGDDKMEKVTITSQWPDNEFTKVIPKVEFGELFSYTEYVKHDRILFVITDITAEDFAGYREDMIAMGYKESSVDNDAESGSITVEFTKKGWLVRLYTGGTNFNIKILMK